MPLKSFYRKKQIEAGCDEAGRGCLAGPVFAAAVILPKNFKNDFLDDSKKLSEKKRNELRKIIEKQAIAWAVASVNNHEIDEINILNASILAMHRAIEKLKVKPGFLLIDGNKFKRYKKIPHECIVKGDGKFLSIAAASVLAKTHRDEFMCNIDKKFPQYKWSKNKGYPTREHKKSISEFGITKYHRISFNMNSNP
ncbi:MAG: ribonuclease HII [Bacteroidales bacterium]|nr:ribonuclease HII [Bacteroidales bacterium]